MTELKWYAKSRGLRMVEARQHSTDSVYDTCPAFKRSYINGSQEKGNFVQTKWSTVHGDTHAIFEIYSMKSILPICKR